jgi:hypothetical protein
VPRLIDEGKIRTTVTEVLSPINAANLRKAMRPSKAARRRARWCSKGLPTEAESRWAYAADTLDPLLHHNRHQWKQAKPCQRHAPAPHRAIVALSHYGPASQHRLWKEIQTNSMPSHLKSPSFSSSASILPKMSAAPIQLSVLPPSSTDFM